MTTKFKIGDLVTWQSKWSSVTYDGIVISTDLETVTLRFKPGSPFHLAYGLTFYAFNINKNQLSFTKVNTKKPQTKEEIIAQRIKKLWNNSNWVTKNPTQAY